MFAVLKAKIVVGEKFCFFFQCFCFCFRPDSSNTFTSRYGEASMKRDEVTRLVDGTIDDDFVNPVKKCRNGIGKYLILEITLKFSVAFELLKALKKSEDIKIY